MGVPLQLLDQKDSRGRSLFQLTADYQYEIGPDCFVTVPAGYVTNFGTIPQFLSWWIEPAQLGAAALVHDWMCSEDVVDDDKKVDSGFSRWLADAVLYEIMKHMGFAWIKRATVWAAVRGWAWWDGKSNRWPGQAATIKVVPPNEPKIPSDGFDSTENISMRSDLPPQSQANISNRQDFPVWMLFVVAFVSLFVATWANAHEPAHEPVPYQASPQMFYVPRTQYVPQVVPQVRYVPQTTYQPYQYQGSTYQQRTYATPFRSWLFGRGVITHRVTPVGPPVSAIPYMSPQLQGMQ